MSEFWRAHLAMPVLVPGADADDASDRCGDRLPDRDYECTRVRGHMGRHLGSVGVSRIVAAWPGTHEPTVADLDDPTPDGVVIPVESLPTHESDEAAREAAAARARIGTLQLEVEALQAATRRMRRDLRDVRQAAADELASAWATASSRSADVARMQDLLREALDRWERKVVDPTYEGFRDRMRIRREAGLS